MVDLGFDGLRRCMLQLQDPDQKRRTTTACARPMRRILTTAGETFFLCDQCDHEPGYAKAKESA